MHAWIHELLVVYDPSPGVYIDLSVETMALRNMTSNLEFQWVLLSELILNP